MLQVGDQVRINKEGTPLHDFIGTITEYNIDDYYHVLVNDSSFNGWYLSTELEPHTPEQSLSMTDEQIIFAQMRGILLHLDATDGWEQDFSIQYSGKAALDIWEQYRQWPQFHALSEAFEGLGDTSGVDRRFIAYWENFIPENYRYGDEDWEEPDVDDGFPMWLEYDDDGQHTPLEEWYPEYEGDY